MDKRLLGTAYHEAAHAVMSWYYGLRMKDVSIVPTDENLGILRIENAFHGLRPDAFAGDRIVDRQIENYVVVLLVGAIAAQTVDQSFDDPDERQDAVEILGNTYGAGEAIQERFAVLERRATNILLRKDIWTRVTALARVLFERRKMTAAEITDLIDCTPGVSRRTNRLGSQRIRKLANSFSADRARMKKKTAHGTP